MLGSSLRQLGVRRAYGVVGGNIAWLVSGLEAAGIELIHTRHESGAGFMATEDSLHTRRPAVVFMTTGPGCTNSLTGIVAATYEGAKVLTLTGATESVFKNELNFQPQSGDVINALRSMVAPHARLGFSLIRTKNDMYRLLDEWQLDLGTIGGVLGCALIPVSLQKQTVDPWIPQRRKTSPSIEISDTYFERLAKEIHSGPTVVWLGWGSRHYSDLIWELVERVDARVLSSPRAKGVYPEKDWRYLGVTGHGADENTMGTYQSFCAKNLIILGSRLSELTTYWDPGYTPDKNIVHVDADTQTFTKKFFRIPHTTIISEIDEFLEKLLRVLPPAVVKIHSTIRSSYEAPSVPSSNSNGIHPMQAIAAVQKRILDVHPEIYVAAEGGNAWAWGPHALRFSKPRWRLSTNWASMGHFSAGIVGLALATRQPVFAITGDGSMLMQSEVSTAVSCKAPAIWIVWNDACYGMIRHGLKAINLPPMAVDIPRVDFARWASAQGAIGVRVASVEELEDAIDKAIESDWPVVIDVPIDPSVPPPMSKRNQSLTKGEGGEWSSC